MKNKNILLYLLIYTLCIVLFLSHDFNFVHAATIGPQNDEEVDDLNDDLEKLEKKEKKYRNIINLKQKEQNIITAQIKKLDNENRQIEETIKQSENNIDQLSHDINRVKSEIEQKGNHISLQKNVLRQLIRKKYQNYSKQSQYFTMLNIANENKLIHGDNISHATGKVGEFVKTIHTEQQRLREDKKKFEEKSKLLEDEKYKLEQQSEHLEGSRNYKRVLASQVIVEAGKYQTKLSKVLEEQLSIQQEISSLSTSQIGNFSLADLPNKSEADFELPVKKPFKRTQGYGKTSFSSNYKGGLHNGIDFVAQDSKKRILAVAKGKVKATGNMGRYGYGKWVAIDHNNGLITLYGHFNSIKVSRGDKIKKGETLGKMGDTGFSTGPHLHLSVFAESTFTIVESSSVGGVYIPTGATVNPDLYL